MEASELRPSVDAVELEQMVRQRAFELFLERLDTDEDGSPESDWRTATAEIEANYLAPISDRPTSRE